MDPKNWKLRDKEESAKSIVRGQIAEVASLMESAVSILVLIGLLLSLVPVIRELLALGAAEGTQAFQTFLGHALNLVIGIEFIKMLAKHSPGSALEVLLYAIARHMVVGNASAMENLLGVAAIGLIFVIRKFCFVPAFGAVLPGGKPAPDVEEEQTEYTNVATEETV